MSDNVRPPDVNPKDVGLAKQSLIFAYSPHASTTGLESAITVFSESKSDPAKNRIKFDTYLSLIRMFVIATTSWNAIG